MYFLKSKSIGMGPIFLKEEKGNIQLELGAVQTVGKRREQQDSYVMRYFPKNNSMLLAVADGMGGLSSGAEVSKMALDCVVEQLESQWSETMPEIRKKELLVSAVELAGQKINKWCMERGTHAGTALIVTMISGHRLYFCSVGDSRLYLYRNGELFQMNEDHSLENFLIRTRMKQEELPELQGSIYSYIGQESIAEIDYSRKGFRLLDNDIYILCTDGFYQALSEEEIIKNISKNSLQENAELLLNKVLKKKIENQDNATLVMMRCKES